MRRTLAAFLWAAAFAAGIPTAAAAGALPETPGLPSEDERTALSNVARDLCGKKLVLLGENGFHGDGKTAAFKARLVRRLIERCGFDAVFFEASHYDFLALTRRLRTDQPVSRDLVRSAIGMVWNQNAEMAPLIDFLFARFKAGRVSLGGLDDQLGSRGAFYSLGDFPAELAGHVADERREGCRERFRRRIWSDYPRERPYEEKEREGIRECLREAQAALAAPAPGGGDGHRELRQMIGNFERLLARDFDPPLTRLPARGRSMYLNLHWLTARLKPTAKVIVWSANSHIAKDARTLAHYAGARNFGSWVRAGYGDRAFALGFSAASGAFRYSVRTAKPIPPAPADSVEGIAMQGHARAVVYLSPTRLAKIGALRGALFDDHQYISANWAAIHDGVVIFRTERPPVRFDE